MLDRIKRPPFCGQAVILEEGWKTSQTNAKQKDKKDKSRNAKYKQKITFSP